MTQLALDFDVWEFCSHCHGLGDDRYPRHTEECPVLRADLERLGEWTLKRVPIERVS